MRKLVILVMAMVLVCGLSLGVMAEELDNDTTTVKAELAEYANVEFVGDETTVREYSEDGWGDWEIQDPEDTYAAHANVNISANDNFNVAFETDGFVDDEGNSVDDIFFEDWPDSVDSPIVLLHQDGVDDDNKPIWDIRDTTKAGSYGYSVAFYVGYDLDEGDPTAPGDYSADVTLTVSGN